MMPSYASTRLLWTALLAAFLFGPTDVLSFVLPEATRRGCPSSGSACFAQAVSPFVLKSDEDSPRPSKNSRKDEKEELSRPERKARERERKQNRANLNHRKHNFAERKNELQDRLPGEGRYDLHSTVVPTLNESSSANDVMRAIKRAQNLHDAHDLKAVERFLLEQTDDTFAYGYRGSLLARLTVAALHMNNNDLARKAMQERRMKHQASMLPLESAAIIRGLLRVHNCTDAVQILEDELSLPLPGTVANEFSVKERIKHRALSLASIVSRYFFEGEPSEAVLACKQLVAMGKWISEAGLSASDLGMPWLRLVQGAARCESRRRDGSITPSSDAKVNLPCNLVYSVLDAMAAFPSDNDDQLYEAISNALVRRVLFVNGAVNMEGCPPSDRGEAAFIGRSNVGKSSLVNMVTNRKSLAFTSKRPGKTQQFNFFAVNDKFDREKEVKYGDVVEGEKDVDSLYLVDLPGFGFAKVPIETRQQWAALMSEYIANRKSLRVLFHLVDARHGLVDEDTTIMKRVGESLRPGVHYVVVLTKADKNVNNASSKKNPGKVSGEILAKLRETMLDCGVGKAPVILTSAETKLGRDDIWRHLRRAAEF